MKIEDSDSDLTGGSDDETEDDEQGESVELETLTRGENWEEEAFRDAGEATFGNQ